MKNIVRFFSNYVKLRWLRVETLSEKKYFDRRRRKMIDTDCKWVTKEKKNNEQDDFLFLSRSADFPGGSFVNLNCFYT